eukprot:4883230-Pyramimonas_sp.AAC.1
MIHKNNEEASQKADPFCQYANSEHQEGGTVTGRRFLRSSARSSRIGAGHDMEVLRVPPPGALRATGS